MTLLLVALGGAAGTAARYGLGLVSGSLWVTFAINVAGSFLLGALVAAGPSSTVRDAVGTGLLGGFTTYSTFSVQAVLEAEGGRAGVALAYVAASVVIGLVAAWIGYRLAR